MHVAFFKLEEKYSLVGGTRVSYSWKPFFKVALPFCSLYFIKRSAQDLFALAATSFQSNKSCLSDEKVTRRTELIVARGLVAECYKRQHTQAGCTSSRARIDGKRKSFHSFKRAAITATSLLILLVSINLPTEKTLAATQPLESVPRKYAARFEVFVLHCDIFLSDAAAVCALAPIGITRKPSRLENCNRERLENIFYYCTLLNFPQTFNSNRRKSRTFCDWSTHVAENKI